MRVAIIAEVFLPKVDGVVHRTLNLIRQLTARGDEVLVVCPQAAGSKSCSVPIVECPSFPCVVYPEYRIGKPDDRLVHVLEEYRPDVLHYLNPFAFGFRCADLLQRHGVDRPGVWSFHTLYGEFVKEYRVLRPLSHVLWWLMREYHNRADRNLTVSQIMRDDLEKRGFERIHCWPPAVDSELFLPARQDDEMRQRLLNGQADKRLLLTVSRLAPEKNVGFLAGLLDRLPDACLAIVGDGPARPALERQFAGRNAHFLGYLKGVELARAYAAADAFVYASETETMGNVILEAMAAGCAVVAPRAGGIPSIVGDGDSGLLYTPGNLNEAEQHTRRILDDAGFAAGLGRAARSLVETWNWENSIHRVREVYAEAIENHRPGAPDHRWRTRLARGLTKGLVSLFELAAPRSQTSDGLAVTLPAESGSGLVAATPNRERQDILQ